LRSCLIPFALILIVVSFYACKDAEEEQSEKGLAVDLGGRKVVMIIASRDFRDEELQKPKSVIEQRGAQVTIACSTLGVVTGVKGMKVTPDILLDQVKVEDYDAVIFVGGPGSSEYWDDPKAHSIAKETVAADKILGAICIAPVTLANAGVLEGKKATVYSSEKGRLEASGAIYTGADVEVDGKIITGNGPGAAEEFGEAIARTLAESIQL
jgi:protease I